MERQNFAFNTIFDFFRFFALAGDNWFTKSTAKVRVRLQAVCNDVVDELHVFEVAYLLESNNLIY
jgi:hypothetical protein